jgi:histidinol-phosphate/aromatic aminotransferase/cobyric acid decarboxylase-like protein
MINLKLGDIKEQLPERILVKLRKHAFRNVNLYPDNYGVLVSKLAKKHGIGEKNIVLLNGVDEGIELMCRIFGQDILIFPPTYYEFLDAPKRNNLKLTTIEGFDGKGYRLSYKKSDAENRSLILLCNPNNPFGALTKKEITELAELTKGIVAIDETYIDFGGETSIDAFKTTRNVLVLRSFSKGYSLAGLRIGYAIGDEKLIDEIRKTKLICNVTSVSVNAAMTVLDEEKYFRNLIKTIKKRKNTFEAFLRKKGFFVLHTETNNIVVKFTTMEEADHFNGFLKKNDVLVNQGDGISTCGLDNSFIRFACGTESQMKALKKIIERYKTPK